MGPLNAMLMIVALVVILGSCTSSHENGASSLPMSSSEATQSATSTGEAADEFVSEPYHYRLRAAGWFGVPANDAWDGAGSPSFTDPTVDRLAGPHRRALFAFGTTTTVPLERFAAHLRSLGTKIRQCPQGPVTTRDMRVDGQSAIVDETHCPSPGGAFVLTAYVIRGHRAYVFFTFGRGSEPNMRSWFGNVLHRVVLRD